MATEIESGGSPSVASETETDRERDVLEEEETAAVRDCRDGAAAGCRNLRGGTDQDRGRAKDCVLGA